MDAYYIMIMIVSRISTCCEPLELFNSITQVSIIGHPDQNVIAGRYLPYQSVTGGHAWPPSKNCLRSDLYFQTRVDPRFMENIFFFSQ